MKWNEKKLVVFVLLVLVGFRSVALQARPPRISEADLFLQQIPSTPLMGLQARAGEVAFAAPAAYEMKVSPSHAYRLDKVQAKGVVTPQRKAAKRAKFSEKVEPKRNATLAPPSGVKKFVIFSACVIRSFYIVRFEANDDPEDPIGVGPAFGPIRHCPKTPQYYLEQATRFSEGFFGESYDDFKQH